MQKPLRLDNLLYFMLHQLVFLGYHSHFASYWYSRKLLRPYVAASVWIHSDKVLSSTGAPLMKTIIKVTVSNKWRFFINHF